MLFLRRGPRFLFIRTEDVEAIKEYLINHLGGRVTQFHQGNDIATEDSTLCFLTDKDKERTLVEDAKEIILIDESEAACLASLINSHVDKLVHRVDMGPASIIMRIAGDEQKIIKRLQQEYQGEPVNWEEGISKGERGYTLLSLTKKPINKILSERDIIDLNLLLPHPVSIVHKRLRVEGLRFITQNLQNSEWYELRINIYDSKGRYEEHYDRLMYILSRLEIGMVLGETWTKDHALALFSVLAYQVRLFTFYTPREVKEVLLALEYTLQGQRLVDFDLYHRNKKISWIDIINKKDKLTKVEESNKYRKLLYDRLSSEDILLLEGLEAGLE